MPQIQASTVNAETLFNLDGLDYAKNVYTVYYDSDVVDNSGVVQEDQLRVGLRNKSDNTTLQSPLLVSDWIDASGDPYTSLATLLGDLSTLVGFNTPQGGGTSTLQEVTTEGNTTDQPIIIDTTNGLSTLQFDDTNTQIGKDNKGDLQIISSGSTKFTSSSGVTNVLFNSTGFTFSNTNGNNQLIQSGSQTSLRSTSPFPGSTTSTLNLPYTGTWTLPAGLSGTVALTSDIINYDNRVVVNQSNFSSTLGGSVDSSKEYFIDGIIDTGDTTITVPSTGLNLRGYSFNVSGLVSSDNSYTMFQSEVGGSGDLIINNLQIEVSGASSQVYDLTDNNGTNAIEITSVNYNNCSSLGEISGYRQLLETGTGRFLGTPELTFSGSWNGVRISTSIVRGLSDIVSLFKTGTSLTFSGRFITDINCDLPAIGALIDFSPSNITNDESLILKGAFITRLGAIDASDTTIYPNINNTSVKSLWSDNTGLPNTNKYIKSNITTEVTTTVSAIDTYYPLEGTFTVDTNSHFDMPSNGEFRLLSGNGSYQITGDFVLDSNQNNEVDIRVTKSTDGGLTYPTQVNHIKRVINSLLGFRDVGFFPINFITDLKEGDRLRVEVENKSSTSDITAELDSYLIISQI